MSTIAYNLAVPIYKDLSFSFHEGEKEIELTLGTEIKDRAKSGDTQGSCPCRVGSIPASSLKYFISVQFLATYY